LDANNNNIYLRYDPLAPAPAPGLDINAQQYFPKKDHFRIVQPGFAVGGPILKDKLWFFLGVAPQISSLAKNVDFGGATGTQYFTQDHQTYYTNARFDYSLTSKIRLYASWLYQYGRETGVNMPISDPVGSQATYLNTSTGQPLTAFSHGLGWSAPNATYNFGADWTITPKIVSTTRFGYFFENYHDFGWQTTTANFVWTGNGGTGLCDNANIPASTGCPNGGNPLPASLALNGGTQTAPYTATFTQFNANKH
jgi:hypothetical protein